MEGAEFGTELSAVETALRDYARVFDRLISESKQLRKLELFLRDLPSSDDDLRRAWDP